MIQDERMSVTQIRPPYFRRSSHPAHGTEATPEGGARPSGEFWLHAGLGDQTVGSETWETGTRNRPALEIESRLVLETTNPHGLAASGEF